MKNVDLIGPGISMPIWPITTAASSVAVTLPRAKPAIFFAPSQKPSASARKMASSWIGAQRADDPVPDTHLLSPFAAHGFNRSARR